MSYRKELSEYMNKRLDKINRILSFSHTEEMKKLELCYKKLNKDDLYTMTHEEEIVQENDLSGYIDVLMRWK